MKQIFKSTLVYILLLGVFLRFYSLGTNPAGFFRDEAAKGYNAYCLYETGHNIDGHPWPLFTRELSTYNSAIYSYLIMPFIALFGLTEVAVRFPAALFACLTILSTYWLVKEMFDKRTALITAFLLAVCPWSIVFSRWANQGILLPFFVTVGLGCFVNYIRDEKKAYWLILSFAVFALSLYTYDIAKVFIVLLGLGLIILFRKELFRDRIRIRAFFLSGLCFLIIILPILFYQFTHTEGMARFSRLSIFNTPSGPLGIIKLFILNWLSHYSFGFLFLTGDANIRHSMQVTGQLYLFTFPLILIGIYFLWKQRCQFGKLLFYWLIIFPIPSSLTNEGIPHALRAICVIPLFSILSAVGIHQLLEWMKIDFNKNIKKEIPYLFFAYFFIALFNITLCLFLYFRDYPMASERAFQYGMKSAVSYAETIKGNYDNIFVSPSLGYPEIFFLFYTQQDPHHPVMGDPFRFNIDWREVESSLYTKGKKNLYLVTMAELSQYQPKKLIFYSNGHYPALKFVENAPPEDEFSH